MNSGITKIAALAATALVPLAAHSAAAQDAARPMYRVLPAHGTIHTYAHNPASLQTWNGTITS